MYFIVRLVKLALLGLVAWVLYKLLWKGERPSIPFFKRKKKRQGSAHAQTAVEEMKKDPVCGTYLPEDQAVHYRRSGETYYFCSQECKQKFLQAGK